jgi:hypothetical protein
MSRKPYSSFIDKECLMLFSGQDSYIHVTVRDIVRESSSWFYKLEFPDGTTTLECCESLLSIVLMDEKEKPKEPIVNTNNVVDFSAFKNKRKKL